MHEKLMEIQNTFWTAYKAFGQDKDIKKWEDTILALKEKYMFDIVLVAFIDRTIIAWTPIINNLKAWS